MSYNKSFVMPQISGPTALRIRGERTPRDFAGWTTLRCRRWMAGAKRPLQPGVRGVVGHFDCGTRILRVNHGPEARATLEIDPLSVRAFP